MEEDFTNLGILDKIKHKSWKARMAGYEQATQEVEKDEKPEDLNLIITTAVTDTNQVAQEAGLGLVVAYLSKNTDHSLTPAISGPIAEKCLSATRSGARSRSLEIMMLLVEIEGPVLVTDTLLGVMDHKTPKNVAAAVSCLKEIVEKFGVTDFPIKKVLKTLPKLFDHKDKNVRAEASNLTCELYKWYGPGFLPSLNDLKPVQLKELNALFETLPKETPSTTRFQRGTLKKTDAAVSSTWSIPETKDSDEKQEAFEFISHDPVSFIDKLPKTFYADLASEKWKERKEACDTLLKLVSHPVLEDGRYFELLNVLAKRLHDPNIAVATVVANILDKMASGLKSNFGQYRNIVLGPLLEKLKEKKAHVLDALRPAIDGCLASLNSISDALDDLLEAMAHSNPSIRQESIKALSRFLTSKGKVKMSKIDIKPVAERLIKCVEDSVPATRDAAAQALACMMYAFTEKAMNTYTEKLDKSRISKINEYFAKLKSGEDLSGQGIKPSASAKSLARSATNESVRSGSTSSSSLKMKRSTSSVKSKATLSASASKSNSSSSLPSIAEVPVRYEFTDDSALELMEQMFGEQDFKALSDTNWKNRLAAVLSLGEKIDVSEELKPEAAVRALVKAVGWKESNFQVTIAFINVIKKLSDKFPFDKSLAVLVTSGLVDKLSDVKVKKVAISTLDSIIATASLEVVLAEAYTTIKQIKAPKIVADCLFWMSQTIKEFGIQGLRMKELIAFIKEMFNSPSAPVRANAVSVLVSIREYGVTDLRDKFSDMPANIISSIDGEFAKITVTKPMAPIKVQGSLAPVQEPSISSTERLDLTIAISSDLLEQLNHSNWKERKAGLEEVAKILERSNYSVGSTLSSEIISTLKARLGDSNKNLASASVEVLGLLAKSMGKPIEKYLRTLVPPMLAQLSDQKAIVRNNVIANFDIIVENSGLSAMVSCIVHSLWTEQPQIRKDLLHWISTHPDQVNAENCDVLSMVPVLLACLIDRNAEVRKLAQASLIVITATVNATIIRAKAADLYRGAQYSSIAPYLDGLGFNSGDSPASISKTVESKSRASSAQSVKQSRHSSAVQEKREASVPDLQPVVEGSSHALLTDDPRTKDHRALADKGLLKWVFDSPRKELIDLLYNQCEGNFGAELRELLFSNDHYKEKDYLLGLKQIDGFIKGEDLSLPRKEILKRIVANGDLILRYLTLRFLDTNTSIFIKCLELLEGFFEALDEAGYSMSEFEASSFMPFFINKLGDPKESMRIKLRLIMKSIGRVYPVSKVFLFLLQGLHSKNSKTRAECLDEMASLIQRNGQSVFVAAKAIPVIAQQVGDRDAPCRNAALNALCQIYLVMGEDTNKYLSKISEKEKDMIAERIRRLPQKPSTKQAPKILQGPMQGTKKVVQASSILSNSNGASNTSNTGRKQFTLDFDKIGIADEEPLIDSTTSLATETRISESSAPFSLKDNEDEEEYVEQENMEDRLETRLDILFSQLRGSDLDSSLEAAKHLEKLLAAHPNHDVLRCRDVVGDVLHTLMTMLSNLTAGNVALFKICKHLIAFLVVVFSSKESAACVPNESIDACVQNVLFKLVDPELLTIDPSKTLSRALNMLMVRAIENCEPNITFRSLLSILRDSANEGAQDDDLHKKYTELVMKCLWKITKLIPTFLKAGALHAELLLIDIDGFFAVAPPLYWKQKTVQTGESQADMPLRTVKTILHELVNELGDAINQYVIVFNDQQTHTLNYIRQMLSNLQKKSGGMASPRSSVKSQSNKGESTFAAELDSIFTQIADKDQTKQGIQRLFDFQKKYPSILPVVEERMAKTGTYFQSYIRKSLANLEASQNSRLEKVPGTPKASSEDYSQTLQKLQKMFNSSESQDITEPQPKTPRKVSPYQSPKKANVDSQATEVSRESRSMAVQELKERLARMKMSMKATS